MSHWPGNRPYREPSWERRFHAVVKREPKIRNKFKIIFMPRDDGAGGLKVNRIYRSMHQFAGGKFLRLCTRLTRQYQ